MITWILVLLLLVFATWIQYLAVMNLQRARDAGTLSRVAYYLGQPVLYAGLLCDFVVNSVFASLLFLAVPREFLVTQRLTRYANGPDGWRKRLALWLAHNLLDPFDPSGQHVKIQVPPTQGADMSEPIEQPEAIDPVPEEPATPMGDTGNGEPPPN